VQELSAKTSSKDQKEQKWAKATSPWRAEILSGEMSLFQHMYKSSFPSFERR